MDAQRSKRPGVRRTGNGDRSARQGDCELLLRFPCSACNEAMNAPLRSIGLNVACLHCGTPIQIPALDPNVVGLETVRRVFEPAHNAAPHMDARQPATPFVSPRAAEMPRHDEPAATAAPPPSPRPSPLPPMPTRSAPACPEPIEASEVDRDEYVDEDPRVYDGRQQESSGGGLHFPRAAHWVCRAVYWIMLVVLFFSIGMHPGFFGIAFLLWLVPPVGWRAAEFITSLLVTTIACPGCGEVYPCVEVWKCGCGYQDHQQRHVINYRCPSCHSRLGHTNCTRCGSTILIW